MTEASSGVPLGSGVHHVSLTVRDLDRSLGFWRDIVGLQPIPRPPLGVDGVWLGLGNQQLHLILHDPDAAGRADIGATPGSVNPAGPHLALAVTDHERTVEHLEAKGITVVDAGERRGQCWVQDPDGYVVEFIVWR
jgi:glyoxylase I family protein